MSGELRNTNSADEGLLALVMLLRFHGIGADPGAPRAGAE